MNYISNGTLPIYNPIYPFWSEVYFNITCLNPLTMQVCILSSFIIIIFILFIFFTLPIYITLYILFGVKLISICECLNPMKMQVCILSSFIIIIIMFILFIFFSVIIGFCLHVILINEFKTFENIVKFLRAPYLFLHIVFIKLIRFCVLVAFCLN